MSGSGTPGLSMAPGGAARGAGAWYENALVAVLSLSAGLVFLDRLGIVFVFPQIQHELALNRAQLGLLMGITSLTWALSSIVISFVSDALGGRAKPIIVICVVGFSCATGLIAVTHSFAALLAARALAGLFFGPAVPLMQSVVAKSSSPHRLGINMGVVIGGVALFGTALPPVLVIVLASAFGWHNVFLCLAIPGILLAVILAIIIRPDAAGPARPGAERTSLREAVGLLVNRNVALALIGAMALIGFLVTFASFSPLFLVQDRAMSTTTRTILLTAIGLAGAVGNLFAPALSDRLPRKTCGIAATLCTMLLPAALLLMPAHHAAIALVLAVQFVAGGAMTLVIFIIPGESVPRRLAATTFALLLSIGELFGGSTSPAVAGLLSDHHGLTAAMWFCCGLGAVSLAAVLGMREPPRHGHVTCRQAWSAKPWRCDRVGLRPPWRRAPTYAEPRQRHLPAKSRSGSACRTGIAPTPRWRRASSRFS